MAKDVQMETVKPGDKIKLGQFKVEFIRTSHSIPDSVCLAIQTPVGMIVHTGILRSILPPLPENLSIFID